MRSADIFFKVVEYVGWAATTILGVGGSWLWNFTVDDPDRPGHRVMTPIGRKALVAVVVSLVCAVGGMIYNDVNAAAARKALQREKEFVQQQLDALRSPLDIHEAEIGVAFPAGSPIAAPFAGKSFESARVPEPNDRLRALLHAAQIEMLTLYESGRPVLVLDFGTPNRWSIHAYNDGKRWAVVTLHVPVKIGGDRAKLTSFADWAGRDVELFSGLANTGGELFDLRFSTPRGEEYPLVPKDGPRVVPDRYGMMKTRVPVTSPWRRTPPS